MRCFTLRVGGLAAVLALAISGAASAHPGIYSVTQKLGTGSGAGTVTFQNDPSGGGLATTTQYVVANDGYVVGFTETAGSGTVGGMLNYKTMPTAYRRDMTPDEKRTYAPAQTQLQPHARCEGVPQLDPATGGANILAWQLLPGTTPSSGGIPGGSGGAAVPDPYFNYIPWQKTGVTFSGAPAGANENLIGEDPAFWIPVVKSATATVSGAPVGGVDLSALATVQEFTDACTAIGGTYRKADVAANLAATFVSKALAPFQTQVAALQADLGTSEGQVTTLTADKAALETKVTGLEGDKAALAAARAKAEADADAAAAARKAAEEKLAAAEAARATAQTEAKALRERRLTLSLPAARFAGRPGGVALVTGPAGTKVTLTLRTKGGTSLATTTRNLGPEGAAVGSLAPSKATLKKLAKTGKPVAVTVEAAADGAKTTAGGTLLP